MHLQPLNDVSSSAAQWEGLTAPSRRGGSARALLDVIVEMSFTDPARSEQARQEGRNRGMPPEKVLLEGGHITQDQLARAIAERHGLDHVDLSTFPVDMAAANLLGTTAAKRYEAVPVAYVDERTVLVAMADPANVLAIDDIAIMTGLEVRAAVASREDIATLISRITRLDDVVASTSFDTEDEAEGNGPAEVVDLRESADDAPVIKLVNQVVAQAVE